MIRKTHTEKMAAVHNIIWVCFWFGPEEDCLETDHQDKGIRVRNSLNEKEKQVTFKNMPQWHAWEAGC